MSDGWKTKWHVPEELVATGMWSKTTHVAAWQPPDDVGGARYVLSAFMPHDADELNDGESLQRKIREKGQASRLVIWGHTHRQVKDAALVVARLLPDYKRDTLERSIAGAWALS